MRKLNEKCGVFGIIDSVPQPCAHIAATALLALQHRGQEGAGIAYFAGDTDDSISCHKRMALLSVVAPT